MGITIRCGAVTESDFLNMLTFARPVDTKTYDFRVMPIPVIGTVAEITQKLDKTYRLPKAHEALILTQIAAHSPNAHPLFTEIAENKERLLTGTNITQYHPDLPGTNGLDVWFARYNQHRAPTSSGVTLDETTRGFDISPREFIVDMLTKENKEYGRSAERSLATFDRIAHLVSYETQTNVPRAANRGNNSLFTLQRVEKGTIISTITPRETQGLAVLISRE